MLPRPAPRRWGRCVGRPALLGGLLALARPAGAGAATVLQDAAVLLQTGVNGASDGEVEVSFEQEVSQHLQTLHEHLGEDISREAEAISRHLRSDVLVEDTEFEEHPQLRAFKRFDADGSGGYSQPELAAFLRGFRDVSKEGFRELWRRADLNGNSEIDYDEFLDCVVNPVSCYGADDVESASIAALLRSTPSTGIDLRKTERKAEKRMEAIDGVKVLRDEEAEEAARAGEGPMKLHLMRDKGLNSTLGAACLDGSDAGFYFAPATKPRHGGRWLISMQGGAWCGSVAECLARSSTRLGSSKEFSQWTALGGFMNANCTVNPHFCSYNRVLIGYCDGSSFTGNRDEPIILKNVSGVDRPIYFRGKRILDAVLDTLLERHGLNMATQVLFSGFSAGGVAALNHADYVNERLHRAAPALDRFRVAPISGFFLDHHTVENKAVWPAFMYRVARLHNSTWAFNRHCLENKAPGARWTCFLPEHSYAHTETPVFLVNSAMDWWEGLCVLFSAMEPKKVAVTRDGSCGKAHRKAHFHCAQNVERCTPFEMFAVNQHIRDFSSALDANPSFAKAGNGAFIHSCHTHVEATDDVMWSRLEIGNVTMRQAFERWWRSDSMLAAEHFYRPCQYKQGGPDGGEWPYQCNPTCVDAAL